MSRLPKSVSARPRAALLRRLPSVARRAAVAALLLAASLASGAGCTSETEARRCDKERDRAAVCSLLQIDRARACQQNAADEETAAACDDSIARNTLGCLFIISEACGGFGGFESAGETSE